MDPSVFLLLSNLLHLQNQLDPSSTLFTSPTASPSSSPAASSSAAPLLFLTLASVLSYAASLPRGGGPPSPLPPDPAALDARSRRLFSVSHDVFVSLLELLRPYPLPLPPDISLSLTLSRLSRSLSPARLARRHRLDPFTVSRATHAVTRLLSTRLFPTFVRPPAGSLLSDTLRAFRDASSLPNVCGAIDSSPISLARLPPNADPAAFRSVRHSLPAVVHLQAVADHRKVFWDVCVKAAGPTDDSSHFRDSLLYHRLTSGELLLGGDGDGNGGDVVTVRGHHVRPYIVGDWCYPLLSFLLTPFSSNATGTPAQNAFDAALFRARSAVEQAFGVLKARWRILQNLNVGLDHAPQTIVACCVLHNICQLAGEPEPILCRDPAETGSPARVLETEKSFYYFGESLRQAMADDLYERQQRLSSR